MSTILAGTAKLGLVYESNGETKLAVEVMWMLTLQMRKIVNQLLDT